MCLLCVCFQAVRFLLPGETLPVVRHYAYKPFAVIIIIIIT